MKIAFISDLHGNMHALEAVLADIDREGVNQIVCGGDLVDPFLRSKEAWELIRSRGIPTVRGNHEDYMWSHHRGELKGGVEFNAIRVIADHLGEETARSLSELPFDLTIAGPEGHDVYVCHASPFQNNRSILEIGFGRTDEKMTGSLRARQEKIVLTGHMHHEWHAEWEGKLLVSAGSVGIPLGGEPKAQYALLQYRGGAWSVEHRRVKYDFGAALDEYAQSGALARGGPVAWLLYDEIRTGERRLSLLFHRFREEGRRPSTPEEWETRARGLLEECGAWDEIRRRI